MIAKARLDEHQDAAVGHVPDPENVALDGALSALQSRFQVTGPVFGDGHETVVVHLPAPGREDLGVRPVDLHEPELLVDISGPSRVHHVADPEAERGGLTVSD